MTTVPPGEPSLPDDGTAGTHDRPPVDAIPAPPNVPDHELLRCIGRVYLARHRIASLLKKEVRMIESRAL